MATLLKGNITQTENPNYIMDVGSDNYCLFLERLGELMEDFEVESISIHLEEGDPINTNNGK